MMKIPVLISVPHAGLLIPDIVKKQCILSQEDIIKDGDQGADQIYKHLIVHVRAFIETDIARAVLDMNRARDDRSKDGIVKTHTIWNVPVYSQPLSEDIVNSLISMFYDPYHFNLSKQAWNDVLLGIDCHTMNPTAPAIGPDAGQKRPYICISNRNGATASDDLLLKLAGCLKKTFGVDVAINTPFKGGYIIQRHHQEIPWIQLEISQEPFLNNSQKGQAVLEAIRLFFNNS